MRRFGFVFVTVLALMALVVPAVDASHGPGNGSHHSAKTATFTAKTNTAQQGGQLRLVAKVKHALRGSTFGATAVVHFASGDVTVALKRHGKSFVAAAAVPVGSDETPGAVPVDVTVTYNGSDEEVETEGTVEANDEDGDDEGDDNCDPATTPDCGDDDGGGDDQGG